MNISKKYTSKRSPEVWYIAWISEKTVIPPAVKIESEQKIGGQFILHAKMGSETTRMTGKFLNLSYGKMVQYTWEWEGSHEPTTVTVEFSRKGNETVISLEHTGFKSEESQNAHSMGWDSYVNSVEAFLEA